MSYKDNQKSQWVQKQEGQRRYVTGLWQKKTMVGNKEKISLKSGRINQQGWENLMAFGDRTILLITKGRRRGPLGKPNFILWACDDFDPK